MKKTYLILLGLMVLAAELLMPGWLFAGGKATANLVVVADTRIIDNPILRYLQRDRESVV